MERKPDFRLNRRRTSKERERASRERERERERRHSGLKFGPNGNTLSNYYFIH